MKTIISIIKILVLVLCMQFMLTLYLGVFYSIAYPLLPSTWIRILESNLITKILFARKLSLHTAILQLFFYTSFYVISFKLFKDKNTITKILFGMVLTIALLIVTVMIKNDIETAIAMALPILVAIALLLFKRKKKTSTDNNTTLLKKIKPQTASKGFIFQTKQGYIHLENPARGIYIQGGAGSGKSLSIFEPIISQIAEQKYTGLLYDFKSPELTGKLLEVYKGKNINTYQVDFKYPNSSNRVNPIDPQYLLKSAYALEYATTLINNLLPQTIKERDFFSDNARMVLGGVIWYLRNQYPQYCTLPHVISLLLHTDIDKLITLISEDYEAGGFVSSLKQAIDRGAEKQAAGVASTLQNGLSQLNTKDIFWILSGNDLDLHLNNPLNPKFLCLGNDSTLTSTYAPVISLIISVAMRLMNQPNQEKSIILLDEAPTIYVANIDQLPATARSNKVATVFGVQDYSQLVDKYGQDKAQVILSNLGNQFYGRTVNAKSAEMIKNLFGKHDKTYHTTNKGTGTSGQFVHLSSNTNTGTSENIQERDRIKVSDITNLEAGEFYGLIAEGTPKEFLKTQFIAQPIKSTYQPQTITTDEQMSDNYNRIVIEAKSIVI